MREFILPLALAAGLLIGGCSSRPETVSMPNLPQAMPVNPPQGSYMLTANTYAGDALHKMLLLRMGSEGGILTTSLVDMNDFERTSPFGSIAAQQVGSRIGQYGFRILEARLAASLAMERRNGEFMLTRDSRRLLADTYDANAVLVGCYSNAGANVFVSVRVVRLADNAVMAAYEYYLPRDSEVSTLLAGTGTGAHHGDGVWDRYNRREQAFAPGTRTAMPTSSGASGGTAKKTAPAPKPAPVAVPKDTPAPQPAAVVTPPPAPQKDTPAPDVPRYVDPDLPPTPFGRRS